MREINFRGMSANGWVYGFYLMVMDECGEIIPTIYSLSSNKYIPIHQESVGQFTGLIDENDKTIYEGDIVKLTTDWWDNEEKRIHIGIIKFSDGSFYVDTGYIKYFANMNYKFRVIGNNHDINVSRYFLSSGTNNKGYQTKFTMEEIEKLKEKYSLDGFEIVEVEE